MKNPLIRILAISALMLSLEVQIYAMDEGGFASGREWLQQMTPKEKMMSLLPPMALYHKFGVRFQKTVTEYIETMDTELAGNSFLQNEDVANIFASTVYAKEPENRLPLERMETVFGLLQKERSEKRYPSIPIAGE